MSKKEKVFADYNAYHDRGTMKWGGYMMSEHTQRMASDDKKRDVFIEGKEFMTEDQVFKAIEKAITKNKSVSVQLQKTDGIGSYYPDLVGTISHGDESGIYLTSKGTLPQKVPFDIIRHMEIVEVEKWWGSSIS